MSSSLLRSARPQKLFRRHASTGSRQGAAAVEFAIIAPLMILFMFGMVEIGRIMMLKNAATHASREGARFGVTPTATNATVVQRVNEAMQSYTSSDVAVTVLPSELLSAQPGDMVTVRVSVDLSSVGWVTSVVNLPVSGLSSETTMRRESTN